MTDADTFAGRRASLARAMGTGVAIIPTAPERVRNRDAHYPYRHDSYFYYLTGFTEPESVLVIIAGAGARSILFCRDQDPEREVWDGYRCGPAAAREKLHLNEAHSVAGLDQHMPEILADQEAVFCRLGADGAWDARILAWIDAVRKEGRKGVAAPQTVRDVGALLDEMRLIKDAGEIATMRRAADISAGAHIRAMRAVRPGSTEFEIEAELLHEFRHHGAQAPAYTPIVAGGGNACILHYVQNDNVLNDGDLLLIDAGCELNGYAADITRTFPVNGRFSGAQKAVYELVLAAQAEAIAQIKPGHGWNAPHEAAVRTIARGLIDFGLLAGSVDAAIETEAYKKFYMHRTGHWLGLDVHDAGDYKREGHWRPLQPGMVLTVEPGCYIRAGEGIPAEFAGIGVRIEDDALVTAHGCEIMSASAPKQVSQIEALMGARDDR